ncbi:MAG: sulfurtransferase [Phycisphaeraceae bacterium]|nr:sulfurtransferase [Phycisphaeraceae bacterium]
MQSNLFTLLGISLSLALQACSTSPVASNQSERAKASVIIEPEALAHSLAQSHSRNEQKPILLDARKLEDYGPAHLAGAQRLDMHDWTAASREGDGPNQGLNNAAAWSIRIGALGIDEHTPVIIYDEGGMTSAARAWFILRECGVRDVRVVNGGWAHLCPLLEPSLVQAGNPGEFAPTSFAAASPRHLVTRDRLKQIAADKAEPVIDVRTPDEFTGNVKVLERRRVGHVPTATNLPHKQMLDENGRLRTPEELRTLFASAGALPDQPAVLYCQSGGRAAFAALAAAYAGIENTSVYYMSMGEWLADSSCPVE